MTAATKQNRSIDACLAAVHATHRVALKKLRGQIKKLYPKVTEHLSYGMPLFKLDGHLLAGFRAAKASFRAVRLEQYGSGHAARHARRVRYRGRHGPICAGQASS